MIPVLVIVTVKAAKCERLIFQCYALHAALHHMPLVIIIWVIVMPLHAMKYYCSIFHDKHFIQVIIRYVSNTIPEGKRFFPKVTSNSSSNQDSGKKEAAQKEKLMKLSLIHISEPTRH